MNHVVAKKGKKTLIYLKGKVYKFKQYKGTKLLPFDVCVKKCAVDYKKNKCRKVLINHCDGGYFKEEANDLN